MSKMPNWRHYHLERNGNTVNERLQRYRRAWELIASLARTSPDDNWRVFECYKARCHAPERDALS